MSNIFLDLWKPQSLFLLSCYVPMYRYVAICKPCITMTIMDNQNVPSLILFCLTSVLLIIIIPLGMVLQLEFCDSNTIDHFFCDVSPLFKISCTDTWFLEQTVIACAVLTFVITLIAVILSYVYIIRTILRYPSAHQRKKAFSTCSSHMIVVSIMYGSCIFIYVTPSAKEQVDINKGVSILNTSVAPLLNPFIYTLRNKQVKQALNDTVKKLQITYTNKKILNLSR
eukprot:XP_017450830.1 PREDICTED: olfactory receptor 6C2-like [Rattus norvegicus]